MLWPARRHLLVNEMLCEVICSGWLRLPVFQDDLDLDRSRLISDLRPRGSGAVIGLGTPNARTHTRSSHSIITALSLYYYSSTTFAWMQHFPMADERATKIAIAPLPTTAYTAKQSKKWREKAEKRIGKKRETDRARNKTRVNIGKAFQRWRELMKLKRMKSDSQVALFLLDR